MNGRWPLKYYQQCEGFSSLERYHPKVWDVILPGEIDHRDELPSLLNHRRLFGTGAEIGVQRGVFSATILAGWPGNMVLVDPWCAIEDYEDDPASKDDPEVNYSLTMANLACYERRCRVLRMLSKDAGPHVENGSLCFCYIDANHHYTSVYADLTIWHKKVFTGGLLAGHDIISPEWNKDVLPAVVDFCLVHRYKCYLVPYPNKYWSYYIEVDHGS